MFGRASCNTSPGYNEQDTLHGETNGPETTSHRDPLARQSIDRVAQKYRLPMTPVIKQISCVRLMTSISGRTINIQ